MKLFPAKFVNILPTQFLNAVSPSEKVARQVAAMSTPKKDDALRTFHERPSKPFDRRNEAAGALDLLKKPALPSPREAANSMAPVRWMNVSSSGTPTAVDASFRAVAKCMLETQLVNELTLDPDSVRSFPRPAASGPNGSPLSATPQTMGLDPQAIRPTPPFPLVDIVPAARVRPGYDALLSPPPVHVHLDANSRALMSAKTGLSQTDPAFWRTVEKFEAAVAADTARNESEFHPRIHHWLLDPVNADVDTLNHQVYAELFLTPDSDPNLGLLPADVYNALDDDGRCTR